MDALKTILNGSTLAHAYLVWDPDLEAARHLEEYLDEHGLAKRGSADVLQSSYDSLGIDEARSLMQFASLKPLGARKYLIITASQITTEAQSALLKSVEEGVGKSVFFFIVRPGVAVLDTLQSRCVVIKTSEDNEQAGDLGKEFLMLDYKERLARAEKFGKDSDREGARALVRSLLVLSTEKKFEKEKLRDLLEANQYLQLSGSSPKGVIGHLALVL